jgi:transposase
MRSFGRKVGDLPLATASSYLDRYVQAVNLALQRVYSDAVRAKKLGEELYGYRGHGHDLLRKQRDLSYQHNEEFRQIVFERLHRNVLEQTSRIVQGDYTRRALVESGLSLLTASPLDQIRLLKNRYVPADLVRRVRDSCEGAKNNGTAYYYALAALKQVRKALDMHVLVSLGQPLGSRPKQRKCISEYLQADSSECDHITSILTNQLAQWRSEGYPFAIPQLRRWSLDFSASTENGPGQGYWYELDSEKQDEILLHIKLPAGIDGTCSGSSPYGSPTLTLRFLDWTPRAAAEARKRAEAAAQQGSCARAMQLEFKAAKLEDQHQQLMNTIRIQHTAHRLLRLRSRKGSDDEELARLRVQIATLKSSRRSAPPRLVQRGHRITLQIPFLAPDKKTVAELLHNKEYTAQAGVDRGIRVPVALSVQEENIYVDELLRVEHLLEKRERLRKHASVLRSEVDRRKNNWEKKRPRLSHPTSLLKKERHQDAVWQKVCRLDREISRLVASRTVWFCEEHNVKTVYFEDLKNYQPAAGRGDLSWRLSSNLWGQIIETVRYMRESLCHKPSSVWTVNPRGTSQTCHVCGKKGMRVEGPGSEVEKKGGEYFYCQDCDSHIHADINAARNMIQVQTQTSSAVPGRANTEYPSLSNQK